MDHGYYRDNIPTKIRKNRRLRRIHYNHYKTLSITRLSVIELTSRKLRVQELYNLDKWLLRNEGG